MSNVDAILQEAQALASEHNLPYFGAIPPSAAWSLLQEHSEAFLVDVRTRAELDWVGFIECDAQKWCSIEWNTYPSGQQNPHFMESLQKLVRPDQPLLFLCRSGARSHAAAALAQHHGYQLAMNILEGFEGNLDEHGHRGSISGWQAAGLPWVQR